ncbi:MAG TPA: hypothetical protein G4O18_09855 [Dehalococcoidia bacterium]|nr:hypothetical protein [Dehalococcoidia bacterium]
MKRWLCPILAIILLMTAIGVNGCKNTGAQDGESPDDTSGGVFLEMLALIPDLPGIREYVQITDYTRIRELLDIARPAADVSEEVIRDYILALTYGPPDTPLHPKASFLSGSDGLQNPVRRQNTGFGPQDINADIAGGVKPDSYLPSPYEAIKGHFDFPDVDDAMGSYDESLTPEIGSYQGITTYTWDHSPNLERRLVPPIFDKEGRGSSLAVQDEYVFLAYTPDNLANMIDASQGNIPSLADNPDFRVMATAFTEMGAHSVILSESGLKDIPFFTDSLLWMYGINDSVTREEIITEASPLLSYYRTFGVGIGYDDEGLFITIVLVYDGPQQAEADVDVFEQHIEENTSLYLETPWRDIVDSYEVWADGRSLRAVLRGDILVDWLSIFYYSDTLLVCENEPQE